MLVGKSFIFFRPRRSQKCSASPCSRLIALLSSNSQPLCLCNFHTAAGFCIDPYLIPLSSPRFTQQGRPISLQFSQYLFVCDVDFFLSSFKSPPNCKMHPQAPHACKPSPSTIAVSVNYFQKALNEKTF